MNCARCGRAVLPFHEACFQCGETLQTPGAAAERKREWDALAPDTRGSLQRDYDQVLELRERRRRWLKEHRKAHAAFGAVLFGLPASFIFGMSSGAPLWMLFVLLPFDLAAGAGLGCLLNRLGGGAYRGMALFAAAFVLEGGTRAVAGFNAGVALMVISGFLLSLCTGYALGLTLELDRQDLGA